MKELHGANGRFLNVVARWPGSTHDSRIFRESAIGQAFETYPGKGVLLGDAGYACRPFLMTPHQVPQNNPEIQYNISHKKTRCVIERTFGMWKRRFHILHGEIRLSTDRACAVIGACAVLHNIALLMREPTVEGDDRDDDPTLTTPFADREDGKAEEECNKEKRIFCAGLLCLDIISICKEFPQEDSDQRCIERFWQRGGNASNNTTVLSILGAPCEFFGTIAKSHEMTFFISDFEKNGIHIENCVYHANHTCSTSFVIINVQNGSRTIINSNKSLPDLTFQEFKTKVDLNSGLYKWMHFEGRPAAAEIKMMLEHVDEYNSSVGESKRITTSVELEKPRPQLGMLFDRADYVFVSKDYAKHHGYDNKEEALNAFFTRIRPGATLILPWGAQGAVAMKKEGEVIFSPAFPPETVKDTLGAGDTFISSTIYNISNGKNLRDAMTFGCKLAGAKVGMNGFMGLKQKLAAMQANKANGSSNGASYQKARPNGVPSQRETHVED